MGIETKISKILRHRQDIVNTGSSALPQEAKTEGYVYRKVNVDQQRPMNIVNAYKLGWENLDEKEAELFRKHMGCGIFSKGSNGEGSIFEIPLTDKLSMRVLRMPIEVKEHIDRFRIKRNLAKRKRLESGMVFGPEGQPSNIEVTAEAGYGKHG